AARLLAKDNFARAEIEGNLGELAFKRGDLKTAMQAVERALGGLGHSVPQGPLGFLFGLAREALVQVLHTQFPRLFVGRKEPAGAKKQLLVTRFLNRLVYAYWFERGKIPCLWNHLRGMNLAEHYSPTPELAQAYSIHAPVMHLVARFSRGIAYAE